MEEEQGCPCVTIGSSLVEGTCCCWSRQWDLAPGVFVREDDEEGPDQVKFGASDGILFHGLVPS